MDINFSGSIEDFDRLFRGPAADQPAAILTRLDTIDSKLETLMATGAEAKVSIDRLNTHTTDLATAFQRAWDFAKAAGDAKDAKIKELQDKVTAGEALVASDFADFGDISTKADQADAVVTAVVGQLNAIGATPADPLPEPAPLPDVPVIDTPAADATV